MNIFAERPRRTARYRPYGAPVTEPWQRAMDNPYYVPRHAARVARNPLLVIA